MQEIVDQLVAGLKSGRVEIYNEFSLQHEIGILMRQAWPEKFIQFERNVSFFGYDKIDFEKKEIDISVFPSVGSPLRAIELKFPRNGQYPEQMFSFCKDIVFLEQLVEAGFSYGCFLAFADDTNFYQGASRGIYTHFRDGLPLKGEIRKPTGDTSKSVTISGSYQVDWKPVIGNMKYTIIEISKASLLR